MKALEKGGPWLSGGGAQAGIARAVIRSDAERAEVETCDPWSLLPARTIHACLRAAAAAAPSKRALMLLESADPSGPTIDLNYADLVLDVERAAVLFADISGSRTPVVSVICPLLPEALVAIWGAETVGIANPINPFLEADAVVSIMNSIGATVLVTACARYGSGSWDRIEDIIARVPTLRATFIIGGEAGPSRDFASALSNIRVSRFAALRLRDGAEDATYMPTGGTTGTPKLVRQTQEKQLMNAWLMGALNGAGASEIVGHGMPNFHVGGLISTSLRAVIFGQTLVMLTADGFRNRGVVTNFWPLVRRFAITNMIITPATAAALLAAENAEPGTHGLHTLSCGGSTISLELLTAFHRRFGIYLRELWGMTEFHGVITGHPNDGKSPEVGSVGRGFAFNKIAVVKIEGGKYAGPVLPGERGILVANGICVGEGYVDGGRATAELFVENMPDGQAWANTGDIGTVDATGHVWVFGREKDLIVRGGHKIDPRVIEEALQHHPDVLLSAAIGQPHPTHGEMPVVYVQLKAGARVTSAELIQFCAARIPERAATPVDLFLIEPMPMTAVGKIAKPVLRTDALLRAASEVARRVLGKDSVFTVDLDDKAKRTTIVITIGSPEMMPNEMNEKLNRAFIGFEFAVEFVTRHDRDGNL